MRSIARLLFAATVLSAALAAPAPAQLRIVEPAVSTSRDLVIERGVMLERQQKWGEALSHYEDALKDIPGDPQLSQRADWAKIHYNLARRYADTSFRTSVVTLNVREALDLYNEILLKIQTHYVDTVDWRHLVRRGTRTLEIALAEPAFVDTNLRSVPASQAENALLRLRSVIDRQPIHNRREAVAAVGHAAQTLHHQLGIRPAAVVMEYVSGASGGLDTYSTYLTGDQLREVYSQIDGNFVGLGIEMKAGEGALLLVSVIPGSPADRAGMTVSDRILAVDGRSTQGITTEKAASLLQGPQGSVVEMLLASAAGTTRLIRVRREQVVVPSIHDAKIVDAGAGIAYLKLASFQRDTSRDLDATLWDLYRRGMKSLIIDVRGNPGGLLSAAVDVSDKFIYQGKIVSTRGRNHEEDYDYAARRANTWGVPLVVLIDHDSASASEIFAAAISDQRRGTIVGSRSYGKGSVQGIFPLGHAEAGLRLTTAKFYSPGGRPISGAGVSPDLQVREVAKPQFDGSSVQSEDRALQAAVQAAQGQLTRRQ
jgi:carboxyl-terminal processing protease